MADNKEEEPDWEAVKSCFCSHGCTLLRFFIQLTAWVTVEGMIFLVGFVFPKVTGEEIPHWIKWIFYAQGIISLFLIVSLNHYYSHKTNIDKFIRVARNQMEQGKIKREWSEYEAGLRPAVARIAPEKLKQARLKHERRRGKR